jgi:small-conductance mechanosensitive channel
MVEVDAMADSGALDTFRANFGGYVLAIVVILVVYSAVDAVAPQYSSMLAIATVLGIVLFYFRKS